MDKIFPPKLKLGDTVRVIAPACSLGIISPENRKIANERFAEMGLELSFGKHVEEMDEFRSSSVASRIEDLHEAFQDKAVKAVFAVIGGHNCNQLLRYIDWEIIRGNPKIFCGYSDITALENAIFAKTGLVTYSSPAYSTFGQKLYFDYTLEYFKQCLFQDTPLELSPVDAWTDDKWYLDQEARTPISNTGWLVVNEGEAHGTILGANLCTFNLLQGTEYFPNLMDSVLFLEDDLETKPVTFDRDLQSLLHLPESRGVRGVVIGRFQRASEMTDEKLVKIVKTKRELENIPVIANVDFGHTDQMFTFPIGGEVALRVKRGNSKITIVRH